MEEEASEELRVLTAAFRAQLEHRARSGLLGVTAGATRVAAPSRGVSLESPAARSVVPAEDRARLSLSQVREELGDCQRCRLAQGRKNLVFGVGNPQAALMFVGEAPGADEDAQGEPFVGAAGQLLTKMIQAMGFARQDVYIANVLKCRPPGNRDPEPDEVAACEPFLKKQIAAVSPQVIVTLGRFAAHALLKVQTPISRLRGSFKTYEGVPLMPTFHPAALLREPARKRETWQDLQQVVAALREMGVEGTMAGPLSGGTRQPSSRDDG